MTSSLNPSPLYMPWRKHSGFKNKMAAAQVNGSKQRVKKVCFSNNLIDQVEVLLSVCFRSCILKMACLYTHPFPLTLLILFLGEYLWLRKYVFTTTIFDLKTFSYWFHKHIQDYLILRFLLQIHCYILKWQWMYFYDEVVSFSY